MTQDIGSVIFSIFTVCLCVGVLGYVGSYYTPISSTVHEVLAFPAVFGSLGAGAALSLLWVMSDR